MNPGGIFFKTEKYNGPPNNFKKYIILLNVENLDNSHLNLFLSFYKS